MKLTIEASAGTGKTYELTTIVGAAVAGPSLFDGADAGSGLIRTAEFARLIEPRRLAPSELLLVTFTDAATRELHARVRARLAELHRAAVREDRSDAAARLAAALREIDTMAISTIHGFCARVLREHGFEFGLSQAAMEIVDESAIARELAMRWWSERVRDHPERERVAANAGLDLETLAAYTGDAIGSRGVALAKSTASGADALVSEVMHFARDRAGETLRARGALTYQDQLVHVLDGVRRHPSLVRAIRERYRLAVIDEAQDTDPVQLEIFARVFDERDDPERLLVMVGDPKQSIYSFRGADLESYLRLRGASKPLRLAVNRRSDAGVVDAVNRLFGGANPFLHEGIGHPPVSAEAPSRHGTLVGAAAFEIEYGAKGDCAEAWASRMLQSLVRGGAMIRSGERGDRTAGGADGGAHERPLRWSDCAVLGRSNDELEELERRLRADGVPTILLGDRSVLASAMVVELRALLSACAEPGRAALVRRAMISKLVGMPVETLAGAESEAAVAAWSERFARWSEKSRRAGVLGIVEHALAERPPTDPRAAAEASRTATDALHLAELVHAELGTGAAPSAMVAALDRLEAQHAERGTRPGDRYRRRIDRADAVTLQTLHGSKGLEYGAVLLPWAGAPMVRARARRVLRVPAERVSQVAPSVEAPPGVDAGESVLVALPLGAASPIAEEQERQEAVRLLYVGVTRARHAVRLFVEHSERSRGMSVLESLDVTSSSNPWPPSAATEVVLERDASSLASRRGIDAAAVASRRGIDAAAVASTRAGVGRALTLWIDTSFTRLTGSADHDAPEALAAPSVRAERDDEPAPVVTRGALTGGRELGTIMHRIFEWAAMTGPAADVSALSRRACDESGAGARFDPEVLAERARQTRRAELANAGGPETTLESLDPRALSAELSFRLPLGHDRSFTPEALAAACTAAPAASPVALFAPVAARHRFGEIAGFLSGTVDLLFVHEGRWWIVDYKTNDLGVSDEDYRPSRLVEAMVRSHYVLQYLLYVVAVRRLLALRGVDATGEWLGGVIYPFVRGVDPREPGRGIFVDRPSLAVIDAIDALLQGPVAGAGEHARAAGEVWGGGS